MVANSTFDTFAGYLADERSSPDHVQDINSRRMEVISYKRNVSAREAWSAGVFCSVLRVALLQYAGAKQVSSRLQLARQEDRGIEFVEAALAVEP